MNYNVTKKIATEGCGLLLVRVCNIGSGFLIVAILTRGLGPEGYGTYAFVQAVAAALSLFMHWGIYTFLTKEIAASIARADHDRAQALETFSRTVLLLSVPLAALVFTGGSFGLKFFGSQDLSAALVSCIIGLAALNAGQQRAIALLSGRSRQLEAQVPEGLVRPVLLVISFSIFGTAWIGNPEGALYLYACAAAATLAATTALVGRTRPFIQPQSSRMGHRREWVRQLPPFVLIAMIGIAIANADMLVLFHVLERADLGQYKLAAIIASIPFNIHSIVIAMLMPRASAAWASGDRQKLKLLATTASRSSFLLAVLYSAVFILTGPSLISHIFGPAYEKVYFLACLLLVPVLFSTFVGSAFTILNMCGEARINSVIAIIGLAATFFFLWQFGERWGAEGAAGGAVLVSVAMNLAAWSAVKSRIGIRCDALSLK